MMEHSAMLRITRVVVARQWLSGNPTGWLNCKAVDERPLIFNRMLRACP